jgi:enoyl-CoA hydratase/carnithine racemase
VAASYSSLLVDVHDHVAVVTMNRPDRLNALNGALRSETLEVVAALKDDDEVRALVLTGAGRGFCAGVDLGGGDRARAAATDGPPQSQNQRLDELGWVGRQALAFFGFDKPTIAAVNGVAAGAGMSLALACDVRVGSPASRFRTVFLERNLSPDSGMSWFLPRIIGYSRAADLIFSSRDVDGDEAYRLGLLDRLVPEQDVVAQAVQLAAQMAALPPLAMRSAKRVLQHNLDVDLEDGLRYEMAGLAYARKARNDAQEAFRSFAEKRPGVFTGT